jgi:hypothetical protein
MQNQTNVIKIFEGVVIPKNGTALSQVIDITLSGGNFSLQLEVTGDGTLKAEAELSNDGVSYLIPEGDTAFLTAITKTSGPKADGKLIKGFTSDVANFMKILITETANADPVTVTGWLAVQ